MNLQGLLVGLIWVVIVIAVLGVIYWALSKLAASFGAPPIVGTAIQIVCVLIAVLVILSWLLGVLPGPIAFRLK